MIAVGLALAVLAAAANAAANVLQRIANREEPPELSLSPRLLWDLLHRKVWLLGLLATIASFLLQVAALRFGALATVQPLIAAELPLTLVGSAWLLGSRLGGRDWAAVGVMTGGLAVLIGCLHPRPVAHPEVAAVTWAIGLGVATLAVAALVVASRSLQGGGRAALLGAASGIQFGVTAAITKAVTVTFGAGVLGVLTSWSTYAMAASGLIALHLMQGALHAGRLVAAQPGITLLDPVVAVVWGILVFGEPTATGVLAGIAGAGGAAMAAGVIGLARSPLFADGGGESEEGAPPGRTREGAGRHTDPRERAGGEVGPPTADARPPDAPPPDARPPDDQHAGGRQG